MTTATPLDPLSRTIKSSAVVSLAAAIFGIIWGFLVAAFAIASLATDWFEDASLTRNRFTLFSEALQDYENMYAGGCRGFRESAIIFLIFGIISTAVSICVSVFLIIPGVGRAPPKMGMLLGIALAVTLTISMAAFVIPLSVGPPYADCVRSDPSPDLVVGYWLTLVTFILAVVGMCISFAFAGLLTVFTLRWLRLTKGVTKEPVGSPGPAPFAGTVAASAQQSSLGGSVVVHPQAASYLRVVPEYERTTPHYHHVHRSAIDDSDAITRVQA